MTYKGFKIEKDSEGWYDIYDPSGKKCGRANTLVHAKNIVNQVIERGY